MKSPYNIRFTIADILFNVSSPLCAAELGIEQRFRDFCVPAEKPRRQVALRWRESREPPQPRGELIYDPGGIWRMYRSGTDYCAHLTYDYPAQAIAAQAQGVLRANPEWDNLELTEQRAGSSWRSLLGSGTGELILRNAMLFTGGLTLHGATVDDNGRGIVFVGHSGAGKSTQAALWRDHPGVTIINHDRIAIRTDCHGSVCHGIPWGGTEGLARNLSAPLAAVMILEQARENEIQRLTGKVAGLLASLAFLPFWDPALTRLAMTNLDAMLKKTPVYRLRFRPDHAVVPMIRAVL